MCFSEDWRYQFTLADNFCLLELIWAHMSSRRQRSIPLGGRYWQVSRYTKWHNECIQTPSMRPYCMVCGSYFSTWERFLRRHLNIIWYNSHFVTSRGMLHYVQGTQLEIFHITKVFALLFRKWHGESIDKNRIAWSVGSFFQREISTLRVISSYYDITPLL